MLKITTLPSGLRVATYKIDRQAAAIAVSFKVGFRNELPGERGISHFLEHLLFQGTVKYPSPKLVKDSVGNLGGFVGAHTNPQMTFFYSRILLEHLEQPLETLSQMLQHSLLNDSSIEKEKGIILEESNRRRNDAEVHLHDLAQEALWPNQAIGMSWADQEESLANITRSKLLDFMKKYYTNKNALVMIVGNVDHDSWVEKVSLAMGDLSNELVKPPAPAVNTLGVDIIAEKREGKQTNLAMAFYSVSINSPLRQARNLMRVMLSQKLFETIRLEKGLAYRVGASSHSFEDTGKMVLQGGFKEGVVGEVIRLMLELTEEFKNKLMSPGDLRSAKEKIKSSIIFENESVDELLDTYSMRILLGIEPISPEEDALLYDKITAEEVAESAKETFGKDFKIAAIGPASDIETLENLYGQKKSK